MKQKGLREVKILCLLGLPLLLFLQPGGIKRITARCERVLDGDTIETTYGGKKLKLRLAFIDAPELKQKAFDKVPIGLNSKLILEEACLGKSIEVKIIQKDRYGRYLSQLFYEGKDLNLMMVEKGHALIYRFYEFESVGQKLDYFGAEIVAKKKRLGVWRTFGFLDPYAYRRSKKKAR